MEEKIVLVLESAGQRSTLSVETGRYQHGGGLAVQLVDTADDLLYATVSVNIEEIQLADDEFVFKTYSENEGLLEAMIEAGFVAPTERSHIIGPICRLLKSSSEIVK